MSDISKLLIKWYLINKRDLPWRKTTDPYCIWLSEIMLQQTQVAQGLPYYLKFLKAFPSVNDLAKANEEQVLKLWQGLGYYSRARNLHSTSKYVANELNGVFPNTYSELKKLKGIGDYTASAIASICYLEPKAVLDGNVFRVLSRLYGIDTPINSTEGQKLFSKLAQELLDKKKPDTNNQAIMEFGARHCTPKKPMCESCIFNTKCLALKESKVHLLPVKHKKTKIKKRFFNYVVPISNNEASVLSKRPTKGIWASLYEFPLIETSEEIQYDELLKEVTKKELFVNTYDLSLYNESPIIHKLSHQHIYTQFWIATTNERLNNAIPLSEIENYPVPVLIANFIKEFSL